MLTPGQAGAQPFEPALPVLRMNRAVARFTSSAPTAYSRNRAVVSAGHGARVVAVECAAGRVLASGFPQGHERNRRGRRRDDVRLALQLELDVCSIPLRHVYSKRSERQVVRGQRLCRGPQL